MTKKAHACAIATRTRPAIKNAAELTKSDLTLPGSALNKATAVGIATRPPPLSYVSTFMALVANSMARCS